MNCTNCKSELKENATEKEFRHTRSKVFKDMCVACSGAKLTNMSEKERNDARASNALGLPF